MGARLTRRQLGKAALAGAAVAGLGGALAACGSGGSGSAGPESGRAVLDGLPDLGVPRPVDYLRTNWSRDPYALCSYSFLAPNPAGAGIRRMLAEPVGRMLFAGEATADTPATVHGAIQAGRSAAATAIGELPAGARVAIVGAGAAGLACAGALLEGGLEPVVLEASERIGGRVREADLDGATVEMGASWIHGTEGNPLTELAAEAGVGLHPFAYDATFPVPGQERMAGLGESVLEGAVGDFDPAAPWARFLTVEDLLPARQGPGVRWAGQVEVSQEYGADPHRLAALATWEGEWLPGGDALLDGTYAGLLGSLAGEVEIQLRREVRKVTREGARVILESGSEPVEADAAVITVPIGVLKAGRIEFAPPLPARTEFAIRKLGAGLLDKLWLAFEEPFWPEEDEGFAWIDPRHPGRWGTWVNQVPVSGDPFLMTLTGGDQAMAVASWSDREVLISAMRAIAAMYR